MTSDTHWTAQDIPDQQGRTAVVTGANSGLGYETARALAAKGATVIMACRRVEKGEEAAEQIRRETPGADLVVMALDLASLESVRHFADEFSRRYAALPVLINNAGVMALPKRQETADGFEMHMGTNHLGHFALTGLLLPLILAAPGARVVSISSFGHRFLSRINFNDLNAKRFYYRWIAYDRSKLANLLFAYELQRRFESGGVDALSVAAHPGYTRTHLQRYSSFFNFTNRFFAQQPAMGALPILYAATAPGVKGCDFLGPGGFMNMRGYPKRQRSSRMSYNPKLAARLWARLRGTYGRALCVHVGGMNVFV